MKYVLFNPERPGWIIPDIIAQNIIGAAKRGKITPQGEKLVMVPDTRYGPLSSTGLKNMKSVRKKDCVPLLALKL